MKRRSSRRRRRIWGMGATVLLTGVGLGLRVGPAAQAQADATQELVERYAPIMMLRTQESDCDHDGEPFAPMSVDLLLDNPQILLRQVGRGDPTVMNAPGASDLAELGEGFYLDYPGDALEPDCLYEHDFDRFNAGHQSAVYAHIARQPDRPDRLAVQYWLFWYYNDWNNKHEGDWEFIQVVFPASSVAEALDTEPLAVGYAQHEGGERAGWNDDKLQRDGTHPLVYSSQRSHASYFAPAVYMGRGASEGFGCDNSESPSTRIEPDVVLLPDAVDDPNDPQSWVGFEGRWGERHGIPNNGPTGPSTKPQWTEPITWQDGLRDDSFVVPTGDSPGNAVIDAFCDVVGWGSVQFNNFVASPGLMLSVLAAIVVLAVFLIRRTSWRAVEPVPLARRRRLGEILRVGGATYRHGARTFGAIGALAIAVAVLAMVIAWVIERLPFVGTFVELADSEGAGGRFVESSIIAAVTSVFAFVLIAAAVAWILGGPDGVDGPASGAAQAVGRRTGALASSLLPAAVIILLLDLTLVGIPIAIWLFVRWQFIPQVTMLDGRHGRSALARSGELVRGRWWHTALVTLIVLIVVGVVGLVVGLVLLIAFTGLPLWALSVIVTVCDVLAMPYGALVMTYLYGDAVAASAPVALGQSDVEPALV